MSEKLRSEIKILIEKYKHELSFSEKFIEKETHIAVTKKSINHDEISLMIDACIDGWLTTGRYNKEFEKLIAEKTGSKIAITVNSGSSANLVAVSTLFSEKLGSAKISEGDEIICVAAGFPTTVNPVIQNRAVPVFIDIDLKTMNIDVSKVENAITKKTKAIVIAHTLGNPFDIERIREICNKYKLWLVQDNCDAFGAKVNGKLLGTFGDIGTLSFYPAHHITMGEGGAVFFNNIRLKRIAESIRDWGRDCYCEPGKDNTCKKRFCWKLGDLPEGYDHKYIYSHLGYNLKITDMQAACGVSQIKKLDQFVSKRIKNFKLLKNELSIFNHHFMFCESLDNHEPSWFGFPITIINNKINRNILVQKLNELNIGTRLLFAGNITKQPYLKKINYRIHDNLNNSDYVMNNTFWIGVHPLINEKMIEFIKVSIKDILNDQFNISV